MKSRKALIEDRLISLGIRPNLSGFTVLADMIELWMREQDENRELPRICDLYDCIAIKSGSYRSRVERSVRLAVGKMYESLDENEISVVFGPGRKKMDGTVTNGEFIATVALLVRRDENMEGGVDRVYPAICPGHSGYAGF